MTLYEIQKSVVEIVQTLRLLDAISWPSKIEKEFLSQLSSGNKPIIKFKYKKNDFSEQKNALIKLTQSLSQNDPLHIYTLSTIESYINSIDMMHEVGHPAFQELSIKEYGRPSHLLFGSQYSHLETAQHFIKSFEDCDHPYLTEDMTEYSALALRKYLKKESLKVFGELSPKISQTSSIVAKAAAGKTTIRIRKNATFSNYDFQQLLVHELMTHTLTAINGSLQKKLPLFSMGAPRTTKTQEGLATFSEIITGSMDLTRLKRISLRVIALDKALNGADFYDIYDYFIQQGQSQNESYLSASRLFRGGYPSGGIAFTKDGVYLEGLIRVHSFFRWAFKTKNLDLVHMLFSGRLDINDIFLLKSAFDKNEIEHPRFLPEWYKNIDLLAGKMAFSLILNGIDIDSVVAHYSNKLKSST